MTLQVVPFGGPATPALRLEGRRRRRPCAVQPRAPRPRPRRARRASCSPRANRDDVSHGGPFAAGPAGIQVWDGPFNGENGTHGTAKHLGSVDWSYDTPTKHYVTIYRAMVTQNGVDAGLSPLTILSQVLALGGLAADGSRVTLPAPPARDPFRRLVSV